MRRDRQRQLIGADAAAVIDHADQFHAPLPYRHVDPRGTGIDGVLQQFLDDARRAFDDFAGGDFIDHARRELFDWGRHGLSFLVITAERLIAKEEEKSRGAEDEKCKSSFCSSHFLLFCSSCQRLPRRLRASAVQNLQSVFFDFPVQGPFADAQHFGRLLTVAAGEFQRFGDAQLFDFFQPLAHQRRDSCCRRIAAAAPSAAIWPSCPANSSGKSSTSNTPSKSTTTMLSIVFRSSRTLPGQLYVINFMLRGRRHAFDLFVMPPGELPREMLDQQRNILRTIGQSRQRDRDHFQPVIQIAAKGAGRNGIIQIAIRRGKDAAHSP